VSDSFYIEKGDPITTDWVTLGQIHDRAGIGPVLAFSLRHGDYLTVGILGEGFYKRIGEYMAVRYANVRTGSADLSALIANPDPLPKEICDDGSSC
jgi:hypothetical protein